MSVPNLPQARPSGVRELDVITACVCSFRGLTHQRSIPALAIEDLSLLYPPYPDGQCAIENEVHDYSPKSALLRRIPSKLVVRIECNGCDDHSSRAQCKPHIG